MDINRYLNELFGIGAPSGSEIIAPIINKMNDKITKVEKLCDKIKDNNQKQICIKENIIKIKRDTRQELIRSYSQCEGRSEFHKEISFAIVKIDKEINELNQDISKIKRSK